MIKINCIHGGSLYHYAHFICDCLFPEVILKTYENGDVVRLKNLGQTIGNFSKIYEEVMGVKNIELDPKEYKELECEEMTVSRRKLIKKIHFLMFHDFIIKRFQITKCRGMPKVILIKRGGRIELLNDQVLIRRNTNVKTGCERREINEIEKLRNFLLERYPRKFKTLVLENIDFKDQVNYFYNAKLIIGIHGAALSNLFFCNQGTKVLEVLGDRKYPFFDKISTNLDLYHHKCENDYDKIVEKIKEIDPLEIDLPTGNYDDVD